ncbi:MAG: fasciclin domain-containing protein [Ginsengibacter sp.]
MKRFSTKSLTKSALLILMLGMIVLSCKKAYHGGAKTIYQTISTDAQYSYLTAAVNKAGLVAALNEANKTGLTLFAPTNSAFKAAGFNSVSDLATIPDSILTKVLLYHVLDSKVEAAQVPQASNTPVVTLNMQPIYATRTSDNKVFINGVQVIKADIKCTNGIIHSINRVLMPATGTIVETAIGNPNLSLLVAAVLRASQGNTNVAEVLSGTGPFTVFAPVNQAFINAGFANEAAINAADPNTLTAILTYHVISGRIFSSDLTNGAMPATVNGEKVTIDLSSGASVKGNSNTTASKIIAADIVTTNGVVHAIDQVLLP